MDPQLLGDRSYALAMEWPLPATYISLDGLAVTIHRSLPSSPLVFKLVELVRRHFTWQRGASVFTIRTLLCARASITFALAILSYYCHV
jgi:hypothetical protein